MTLLEKLDFLIKINDIKNLHKLSEYVDIPYTTFRSFYSQGTGNIKLNTARKICDFFNLTLDEFLDDKVDLPEFVENDDKNSILKVKRKYPKPDYSEKTKKNIEALKIASVYEKEIVDLSKYDEDTRELILKIVEMNKKNKQN